MNRHILVLMLCLGVCLKTSAEAVSDTCRQEKSVATFGGIKADVCFLNFLAQKAPGAESTLTPGFALGGFADIRFNRHIGIRPEVNLNFKQTVMDWGQNSGRMQSFGIEVPIYIMGHFNVFRTHQIFVGLGPYTEFSCYAKWMIDGRKVDLLEIHESGEPMIQNTQSGFGAIIGYEFANGLAIDISYRLCCFNILQPNTSQGVSLYPQSVSLGLAYKFGKK